MVLNQPVTVMVAHPLCGRPNQSRSQTIPQCSTPGYSESVHCLKDPPPAHTDLLQTFSQYNLAHRLLIR